VDTGDATAEATEVAETAQDPVDVSPGSYTVILRPAAVQEMFAHAMICDAKATDEGRTFLRDKLGERVCGENVTIRSDPADLRCPGSPYQGSGLASKTMAWVERGVLKSLAVSRYWGKKTGRTVTGGPANLIFDGGEADLDTMIASTERGLLVTRFWYIRDVDPMRCLRTGMTRDGLFLIEGGKIVRAVKQLRFNECVPEALSRVETLGRQERIGSCLVPTLKIRDFRFTSGTTF
jgi:predicted Zn-dependent protease